MSMRTWTSPRRVFRWAFLGLFGLFIVAIAASIVVYAVRGANGNFGFFPFGFGWFFILLFFLFFWGMRWWGGWGWGWYGRPYGRSYGRYADDAHAILRTRYARGDITKEQFDQMMRDLEQHP